MKCWRVNVKCRIFDCYAERIMMKHIVIVGLVVALVVGCKKDKDPGFTSPVGSWAYTTPDGNIGVTFDVVTASGSFDIQNQAITVNGVVGKAEKTAEEFMQQTIKKIRINANDTKLVYSYDIVFNSCSISSDFKTITATNATYTYPSGTTNTLNNISIVRK